MLQGNWIIGDMTNMTDESNERLTWVVADIHGCYAQLLNLEERIRLISESLARPYILVSVGDLIDRGAHSAQVVEHWLSGTAAGTHTAVLGNHEMLFLSTLYQERPDLFSDLGIECPYWFDPIETYLDLRPSYSRLGTPDSWKLYLRLHWTSQGGAETLESYGCDPSKPATWSLPSAHLRYLCGLPFYWEDASCVVTHALAHEEDLKMLRRGEHLDRAGIDRTVWSRTLPPKAPDTDRIHASGHTPLRRIRRDSKRSLIRLDLGVYNGGRLAGWCAQLNRTVSVPSPVLWQRGLW
jgi:hypothetical protein